MFGGRLGFNFSGKRDLKEEDEEDEVEEEDYENEGTSEEEEDRVEEDIDAFLIPSDNEKKAVLAAFDTMRKESLFCDISFVCQGVLFRAHRVIVSSWSRWLRAFLSESPEEEVLSLDIFEPLAFRAVLDYMYGVALEISVKVCSLYTIFTSTEPRIHCIVECRKYHQGCPPIRTSEIRATMLEIFNNCIRLGFKCRISS